MSTEIDALIQAARDAAANSYAPYSNFHVGAALRLKDGSVVTAANVENASYGLSLCAEAVAVAKASSDGLLSQIREVAIIGGRSGQIGSGKAVVPCGRCRQILQEAVDISGQDIAIHCAYAGGYDSYLLSELLPNAFGPSQLN